MGIPSPLLVKIYLPGDDDLEYYAEVESPYDAKDIIKIKSYGCKWDKYKKRWLVPTDDVPDLVEALKVNGYRTHIMDTKAPAREPHVGGIKTEYKGIQFRSMLEARYAAWFDLVGWQWVYEPFEADHYIPDFMIQGEHPFLVEVKPAMSQAEYMEPVDRISKACAEVWKNDILILGTTPFAPTLDDAEYLHDNRYPNSEWELRLGSGNQIAGWFGEYDPDAMTVVDTGPVMCPTPGGMEEAPSGMIAPPLTHPYSWDVGYWCYCTAHYEYTGQGSEPVRVPCGNLGVWHLWGSWNARPCSHHDKWYGPVTEINMRDLWNQAGNTVRWEPS